MHFTLCILQIVFLALSCQCFLDCLIIAYNGIYHIVLLIVYLILSSNYIIFVLINIFFNSFANCIVHFVFPMLFFTLSFHFSPCRGNFFANFWRGLPIAFLTLYAQCFLHCLVLSIAFLTLLVYYIPREVLIDNCIFYLVLLNIHKYFSPCFTSVLFLPCFVNCISNLSCQCYFLTWFCQYHLSPGFEPFVLNVGKNDRMMKN